MKNSPEESYLIEQVLAGDEEACKILVRRYQNMVARVIERITRRPEWVEDLAQEVFISAFNNLSGFKRRSGLKTWLYRIAVNTSIEALRKEKARIGLVDNIEREKQSLPDTLIVWDHSSGERMLLTRELQMEVHGALEKLSADSTAVLVLRYLEELSTREIAQVLKIPEGTVRSRLYYARLELASVLAPFMEHAMDERQKKRE